MGEVWRRLIAKVLMKKLIPGIRDIFPPVQYGVGIANAVPFISHTFRLSMDVCEAQASLGILQVDLKNAFNTVSRHILNFIPLARTWAQWSLSSPGLLFCQGHMLWSKRGVQQGDPLDPFLFSCGIQIIIDGIRQLHPTCGHLWYLDDGTVIGPLEDLNAILNELEIGLHAAGLELNL